MGIRLESARAFFKNEIELTRWAVGNVGIEAIANPALYGRIVSDLLTRSANLRGEPLRLVDFGAGSLRLERDLFCEDPVEVFGLRGLSPHLIADFRSAPIQTVAYEASESLLRMGRVAIPEAWIESKRIIINHHDFATLGTDLGDASADLIVSRNLLMNLSPRSLRFHLCEVLRLLKPGRRYLAVVLNPEYQRRKLLGLRPNQALNSGKEFSFPRGASGELIEYLHYFYRSLDYVELFSQSGLEVADVEALATPSGWEESVPRYYDPFVPVFLLITAFKV